MFQLDPVGTGPITVLCDMSAGGWTRVMFDDFEVDGDAWSVTSVDTCGRFGQMLGRLGSTTVNRPVDLLGVVHTEVRLTGEFVAVDSWDDEDAWAEIDGTRVWSANCDQGDETQCNQSNDECFGGWPDGVVSIDTMGLPHIEPTATLEFGATLNSQISNESWGLDDIAIWVR